MPKSEDQQPLLSINNKGRYSSSDQSRPLSSFRASDPNQQIQRDDINIPDRDNVHLSDEEYYKIVNDSETIWMKMWRRLPFLNRPGIYLLVLNVLICVTALIFYFGFPLIRLWNIRVYWWLVWILSLVVTLMVVRFVVGFIWILLESLLQYTAIFYFINGLERTLAFVTWSSIQLPVWPLILHHREHRDGHLDEKIHFVLDRTFVVFLVLGIARLCLLVLTKVLISHIQRRDFWPRLSDFIFKEKIFDILIRNPKAKKLKEINSSSLPKHYQFSHAWSHVFHKGQALRLKSDDLKRTTEKETSMREAALIGERLFSNLDTYNKGYIKLDDFRPFFRDESDARRAFRIFDKDANGEISLEETIKTVYEIYKDRKALFVTLHDRENVAAILGNILGFLFWVIMAIVTVSIYDVDVVQKLLIPLGTVTLAFTFIFGNSVKNVWESVIFIFVVKPYDVGDRVTLSGYPTLIVNKISLYSTEFYATDGRQFIIPNSFLLNTPVTQYKRSRDYAVYIQINVGSSTVDSHTVEQLRDAVFEWLKKDEAPWNLEQFQFWISSFENVNRFTIDLWAELQGINWHKSSKWRIPQSRLFLAIQEICRELKIEYSLPDQTIHVKKIE